MARRRGSKRRRRGRLSFLYKLLAVLAICAAIVTGLTMFFRVEVIEIRGNSRYTEEEIRAACAVEPDSNMYLLNKYAVVQRLQGELPYIELVHIDRVLPDRLVVTVTECSHTYAITQGGVTWIFSSSGKIVDRAEAGQAPEMPAVDGCTLLAPSVGTELVMEEEEGGKRQESLKALLKAAESAGMTDRLTGYHLESDSQLTADYEGRFAVQMPYGADYTYMLTYLTMVMEQLGSNESGVIDLTVPGEAHVITDT